MIRTPIAVHVRGMYLVFYRMFVQVDESCGS